MSDESFMKSLFGGVVTESLVYPYPEPSRGDADQVHAFFDGLRKLSGRVDSAKIDREETLGKDVLDGLREIGAFGLLVPKDYGGAGLSLTAWARAAQELASLDPAIALTLSAHASLGVTALLHFASDDLKTKYLPRLATGESIAAFALAEVGAGSDAASIQTRADREGSGFVLQGKKT